MSKVLSKKISAAWVLVTALAAMIVGGVGDHLLLHPVVEIAPPQRGLSGLSGDSGLSGVGGGSAGAIQSRNLTDQITTPATLTTPAGPCTMSLFLWPDHVAGAGDNNDFIQFANAGASGRIWLQWDNVSNAALRQAWAMNVVAGQLTAKYPTQIPARTWSHLMFRFGRELDAGNTFNVSEACLGGVSVINGGGGTPVAGTLASITLFKDIYGQNSPSGLNRVCRAGVWDKMCLSEGESWYAAMGGDIGSIRPSQKASKLVLWIEGSPPIVDAGPNALPLTITGVTAQPIDPSLRLLAPAKPLLRAGNIYMVTHRGGTGVGERETTMYMAECTDGTGANFEARPCYLVPPASHVFTDADVFYDPVTRQLLCGCINTTDGTSATWDLYTSTDGNEWKFILSVDCSAIATGATPQTYKPRFFLDDDNSLHVDLGLGTSSSNLFLYEQHPTNRNDLSQPWSTPVIIAGSGLPTHAYDSQTVKEAGTYYKFFSNADNLGYMNVMSSGTLTTGYTMLKTGDWAGLGQNAEGICLIQRTDGKWVLYPDQSIQQHRVAYSVSSIAGTLANVLANATWSAPAPINIHGLPDVEGNFVAQGPTVRIVTTVPLVPSAPTTVVATSGSGSAGLTWDAMPGTVSYNVYRGTASGAETLLATAVYGTAYTATGLTNGTPYYFKVSAVNGTGESALSSEATATPVAVNIAFVAGADLGNTSGGTLTTSYTVGSGTHRMLVVAVKGDTADSLTGVTYNGVAMTLATKCINTFGQRWTYLYYQINAPSGAHNIVISQSTGFFTACAADYTGVLQSGQPDAVNTASTANTNTLTANITTVAPNCWSIMAWGGGPASSTTPVAGTGSTRRTNGDVGILGLFDSNGPLSTGANSMTANYGADSSAQGINACIASFAPG